MPVNREELLAKLAKMGLSKTNMYRMNHGIVAVEEFVASEGCDYKVSAEDQSFDSPDHEDTVHHVCPKCLHAWDSKEYLWAPDTEVSGDEIADLVEVSVGTKGIALSPGSLVLTAEEVAFMLLDFAGGKA